MAVSIQPSLKLKVEETFGNLILYPQWIRWVTFIFCGSRVYPLLKEKKKNEFGEQDCL